jgi:MFS family permease
MNDPVQPKQSWTKLLNRYHWFVLIVASLGWMFDCLDQQLFNLARVPAMKELVQEKDVPAIAEATTTLTAEVKEKLLGDWRKKKAGDSTAFFLIGWATGGLIFGMLGDRIGRAKTMMWTILIYSLCTGLSALSKDFTQFAFFRFITGLGVGGEFAVGVALVAEVMPERARASALGLLQALSAVGNISAAVIGLFLSHLEESGAVESAWRWMFVIGALPALLALVIRMRMKEPAGWQKMKDSGELAKTSAFTYGTLFADRRWRRNAIIGMLLSSVGVIGTWGIGFFSIDLSRYVFQEHFKAEGLVGKDLTGMVSRYAAYTSMMLNVGAFFGMLTFSKIAQTLGRRPALALSFITSGLAIASVFWFLKSPSQVWWHIPIMGFFQLSVFACYAIYLPELFPTELRSTGTSFCYNVGRYIAASGPALLGMLTSQVYGHVTAPENFRYAGVTMCSIFVIGLILLPFAPETRGKPLPENERGFAH